MLNRLLLVASALAVMSVLACGDGADTLAPAPPGGVPGRTMDTSSQPVFLHPAAGAPSIANPVVSFYAKKGEDRSVQMVYHLAAGQKDSTVFIDLRVPARALAYRPDGTPFAAGDSVLITITLVDPTRLIADFEPTGLRFSPDRPAHLKISYAEADSDLNGDGTVNATDRRLTSQLRIWGQESAGDPWFGLNSVVDQGVHEVEAELGGFTSYSIGL